MAVAIHAFPLAAGELKGTPKVVDGDTIILQESTVRLYGVDAPELGQTCWIGDQDYDCGMVARTALMDLTAGTPVVCRVLDREAGASDTTDQPGRCFAGGYDLSEGMAYTGWALAVRTLSDRYAVYEDRAKAGRRGLWKGRFVKPWDWRGGKRRPDAAAQ
jgi:endonuclease YncB( thermonuclease family)